LKPSPSIPATTHNIGSAPGDLHLPANLLYDGPPRIRVFRYSKEQYAVETIASAQDVPGPPTDGSMLWISIEGLADLELFRRLMTTFDIDALAMEDALSRRHRPKMEVHGDVTHFIGVDPMTGSLLRRVGMERVSLFLGKSWVISIEDAIGDTFDGVIKRLERRESRLRKNKPDLLFHALVDALADRFFPVIDKMSRILDGIDREVSAGSAKDVERRLHRTRKKLFRLREVVWPMKEAVGNLMIDDTARISESTRRYFRDASDHLLQIIEHLDSLREMAASVRDVHYSQMNARMNEIMRNLAVLSAVFMPMTFVVGVYGMNFDKMPELRWENGYYICLAVIAAIGVGFWFWFKRKKWIDVTETP